MMKPNMVLYAKRGDIELYVPEGEDPNDVKTQGIIFNPVSKDETPVGVQQALKWGYWVAVTGSATKLTLKGSPTSGWYSPPKGTHSGERHRAVGSGRVIVSKKPVPKRALGSSPVKSTYEIDFDIRGANEATIVEFEDGTKAIFKPADGMDAGDVYSEVLAYSFSKSIGWDLVPETTTTDIDYEVGSLQRWIPKSKNGFELHESYGWRRLHEVQRGREFTRMAVMDRLISNPDRHDGNYVVGKAGRVWAIDNGLAFSPSGGMEAHKRWIDRRIPSKTKLVVDKLLTKEQKKDYALAYTDVAKWSQTSAYRDYVDSLRSTIGAGTAARFEYAVGVCRDRYGG